MPSFVIDASATPPWRFEDEATPWTESLLNRIEGGGRSAAFLELVQQTGFPLATFDNDLRRAAASEGVALVDYT